MKIFKYSALAAIVIAVIGIVACSKSNSEPSSTQNQGTKDNQIDFGIFYCCRYTTNINGVDTCVGGYEHEPTGLFLCYIDMTCLQQYDNDDPEFPIIPPNGADSNVMLCLPNYASGNEWMEQMFDHYFELGEITFTEDCPAGTPELMEYLPEGYLPAGSYPISKHGNDAWIDITLAVQ